MTDMYGKTMRTISNCLSKAEVFEKQLMAVIQVFTFSHEQYKAENACSKS